MDDEEYVANDDHESLSDDQIQDDVSDEDYHIDQEQAEQAGDEETDHDDDYDAEEGERKGKRSKRSQTSNDPNTEEEIVIRPYALADKFRKARNEVEQIIKSSLRIEGEIGPAYFATVEDYDRFIEDKEQYIYNIAKGINEKETFRTLALRLTRLTGPPIPVVSDEEMLESKRRALAINFANLQFKIDKRVKPLLNAAQPSNQGGRDQTLSAAANARVQLQEAAKWLREEEVMMDSQLESRKIKAAEQLPSSNRPPMANISKITEPVTNVVELGPKPLSQFPPEKKKTKDESETATGYSGRIIEERRQKELFGGLMIKKQ